MILEKELRELKENINKKYIRKEKKLMLSIQKKIRR